MNNKSYEFHKDSSLVLAISLVASLFFPSVAFSEPVPKHDFRIGTEIYQYIFTEKQNDDIESKGTLYGVAASYIYHGENLLMFRGEGRVAWGEIDTSTNCTDFSCGSNSGNGIWSWEARGLVGYDFIKRDYEIYTLYTGLGYKFVHDDSGGSTYVDSGLRGYDREFSTLYLPIGVDGEFILSKDWNVAANLEFDVLLWGEQRSLLSTAFSDLTDSEQTVKSGYGYRFKLDFKKFSSSTDFVISPFLRHWRSQSVEASDAASGVGPGYREPSSNTDEYGVNASLAF